MASVKPEQRPKLDRVAELTAALALYLDSGSERRWIHVHGGLLVPSWWHGNDPLAVVTAFASASRLVIGQESFRAADGDSEILAARALLSCLNLKGQLVTADAIHC